VSFKGLTGAFLVRVSSKGLSVDPRIFCLGRLMIPPPAVCKRIKEKDLRKKQFVSC
jgi:hypothetical protein